MRQFYKLSKLRNKDIASEDYFSPLRFTSAMQGFVLKQQAKSKKAKKCIVLSQNYSFNTQNRFKPAKNQYEAYKKIFKYKNNGF